MFNLFNCVPPHDVVCDSGVNRLSSPMLPSLHVEFTFMHKVSFLNKKEVPVSLMILFPWSLLQLMSEKLLV